jgi:hypothetical protein
VGPLTRRHHLSGGENMEQKKTQMAKLNTQSNQKGVKKKWIAKHDYLNANKGNNHDMY